MTMGEGGAVYTDDAQLNIIVRSMRDWGRECICPSGMDNLCGHRFDKEYSALPKGYDHKYVYSHFGYNLKATDMQAAVGCAQLEKLEGFIKRRRENYDYLKNGLSNLNEQFVFSEACEDSKPSWFGFLLTCKQGVKREAVVRYLEQNGIQTRMLFAGNLIMHPCFDEMRDSGEGFRVAGELKTTNRIMNDTFWIGVYPGMTTEKLDYMIKKIKEAVK